MKTVLIKTVMIMLFIIGIVNPSYAKTEISEDDFDYPCQKCGDCSSVDETKKIWDKYEEKYPMKEYTQCLENKYSDFEMSQCTWEEVERQEVLLNRKYKKLMSSLPKNQKIALRNYQRKWIKKRKEISDCYGSASGGGTMDLVNGSGSYLFETIKRISEFDQCLSAKKISRNSKGCEKLYPLK